MKEDHSPTFGWLLACTACLVLGWCCGAYLSERGIRSSLFSIDSKADWKEFPCVVVPGERGRGGGGDGGAGVFCGKAGYAIMPGGGGGR